MNRKLTEEQVVSIKQMILAGYPNDIISTKFSVKPNTISDIRRGVCWRHVLVKDQGSHPNYNAEKKVSRIKLLISKGYDNKTLAKRFHLSQNTISDIRRNVTWADVKPEEFEGEEWDL